MFIIYNTQNKKTKFMAGGTEYSVESGKELKFHTSDIPNVVKKAYKHLGLVVFDTDKDFKSSIKIKKIQDAMKHHYNFLMLSLSREYSAKKFLEQQKGSPVDFMNLKVDEFKSIADQQKAYMDEFNSKFGSMADSSYEEEKEEEKPFIALDNIPSKTENDSVDNDESEDDLEDNHPELNSDVEVKQAKPRGRPKKQ